MFQEMLQGGSGGGTLDTFNFIGPPSFFSSDLAVNVEIGVYYLLITYSSDKKGLTIEGGNIVSQIKYPLHNTLYGPHYERFAIVKATSKKLRPLGFPYAIAKIDL